MPRSRMLVPILKAKGTGCSGFRVGWRREPNFIVEQLFHHENPPTDIKPVSAMVLSYTSSSSSGAK